MTIENNSKPSLEDSNYSITEYQEQNIINDLNINNNDDNKRYLKKRKGSIDDKSLHRFYKPPHIIKDKKTQRVISIIWGIITILISGTLYGFSIISNEIRDKLDLSQTDIGTAIAIGDVGIYIGLTVGYFFDLYGPFYTCLLSTACYILGYMGVWGIVNGSITNNIYLLSFFLFIIGQGSHASFTAAIVPNVHNYTIKHRGKISGVLVGMFALSSGVFGLIYKSTFKKHNNVEGYLLFLAILLSSVALIASFIVRVIKIEGVEEPELEIDRIEREKQEELFKIQQSSTDDLTIPEKLIIEEENAIGVNSLDSSGSSNLGAGGDINSSSDSSVTKKEGKLNFILNNITNNLNNNSSSYKLLNKIEDFDEVNAVESGIGSSNNDMMNPNYLDGKRDISGLALLKTLEFWLMWIIYFTAAGGSLMFLNNIAVMAQALGKPDSIHSDLVIVFACSNLTGRVSMGLFSDLIASRRFSRFWCVVLSSFVISFTHLITSFDLKGMFIPGTILTGIGYGGMVSIMVSLTTLRFGSRRFGINFGFLAISSASASLIFGSVSSKIYDNLSSSTEKCHGNHCFQTSFIISFTLNFLMIFIGMFIIHYNRKYLLERK